MRSAASIAADAGADLIDINMGCPVRKVCGSGAGAALLQQPDLAMRLAKAAVEGSRRPVTVKLRSGLDAGGPLRPGSRRAARGGGRRRGDRFPSAKRRGPAPGRAGLRAWSASSSGGSRAPTPV